jgi:hypothetical protein
VLQLQSELKSNVDSTSFSGGLRLAMGQYKYIQVEPGLPDWQCSALVRSSFGFHSHLVVQREIKIKLKTNNFFFFFNVL